MNAEVKEEEATERPWPAGAAEPGFRPPPPGQPADASSKPHAENPAATAMRLIPLLLGELRTYAGHFIAAKVDGWKVAGRNIAIYAALGVIGLLVAAGVLVTAVAMLVVGIAHAIGALLGGHAWLGEIIVGVLILSSAALVVYIALSKVFKTSRAKTEQKYEGKRIQQRVQYGRDATERGGEGKP